MKSLILSIVIVLLLCTIAYAGFPIPLTVTEPSGIARANEYVTFGVPISRADNLLNTNTLGITFSGSPVEAQFNVTSRWDGTPTDATKPIRWILVTFKVGSLGASAAATYNLVNTGSGSATTGISISETAAKFTVNTGAAEFEILKSGFNLFDKVTVGSTVLVASGVSTGGTITDTSSGANSSVGGLSFTQNQGTYHSHDSSIVSTEIDSTSGNLHAVVMVRGKGVNPLMDHLEWTARLHFYKDSSMVKVQYSFTDRALTHFKDRYDIDYIGLHTKLDMTNPTVIAAGEIGTTDTLSASLTTGQSAVFRQTGTVDQGLASQSPGAVSTLSFAGSGQLSGSGNRARGWMTVTGASGGVMVVIKDFWQMYPKRFDADADGNIDVVLWPSEDTDMTVYCGAQRTHTLLYNFYTGTLSNAEQFNTQFQQPLMLFATPQHYSTSGGFGVMGTLDTTSYPIAEQSLITSLGTKVDGIADTIVTMRNDKFGKHSYGMWNHGAGTIDADGYWAANDYDLNRQFALSSASSTTAAYRYKWFTLMGDTSRHTADVYLKHNYTPFRPDLSSNNTAIVANGNTTAKKYLGWPAYNPCGAFHNMGEWSYLGASPNLHHVAGALGLSYYYYLTGDSVARESALDQRYYLRTLRQVWTVTNEGGRTYGAYIEIWQGIYGLTGDSADLDDYNYWLDYASARQTTTSTYDPNGFIWKTSGDNTTTFFNSLMFMALVDATIMLPNRSTTMSEINNAASFTEDSSKHLWSAANKWFWRDKTTETYPGFRFSASAGMGYAYAKTGQTKYKTVLIDAITAGLTEETVSKEKDVSSILRGIYSSIYFLQITPKFSRSTASGRYSIR